MSDHRCNRCNRPDTPFRVKAVFSWKPVCRDCIEPGDVVYADLPNGQLLGDVAPEVSP